MESSIGKSARGTTPNSINWSNNEEKLDKNSVKFILRRYPTSEKWDLYKFKMALFGNGDME